MKQQLNLTAIIVSLLVFIAVISIGYRLIPKTENTVDVTGTAEMTASPDKVAVYSLILTKAKTAEEAKNANAEISSKVTAALALIGIEKENIETENYNIYEDCEWTQSGRKCAGFQVSNSIKISSGDFDKAGNIVDAVVDSGALVSYINFELSLKKQNEYKRLVLAEAAEDARSKAEALASGFNKKVGKLVSVSSSDYGYTPYPLFRATAEMAAPAKEDVTGIQPSSLDITATVSARYEIK